MKDGHMQIELRDYQVATMQKVLAIYQHNPYGKAKFVWATGLGKTVGFSAIAQEIRQRTNTNVLIIAHRDELLNQAAQKYRYIDPYASIGKVGGSSHEWGHPVTVASIQTLCQPQHLKNLKRFDYGLVVVDEAHHALSINEYGKVLAELPNAFKLGCTATDDRLDSKSNADLFGESVHTVSILDAIKQGYLCNVRAIAIKTGTSLDGLYTREGDYQAKELAERIDTPERNTRIAEAYLEHASGRQAICFSVDVDHAFHLAEAFNARGIKAIAVHGNTPKHERARILRDFESGLYRVVVNCSLYTEGYDAETIYDEDKDRYIYLSCAIMARPTKSRALFTQCLDMTMQILTPDGWRSHHEVREGDLVAGYDKDTGKIKWVPALSKVERPLVSSEKMIALRSPTLDIRVTGGHRMLYRKRNTKLGTRTAWSFIEAQDLCEWDRRLDYEIPIASTQEAPGLPLSDDELRFIGWFLSDGTLNKATGTISITQALHQPHHEAIKSCLAGCGFKYTVYEEIPKSQYNATSNRMRYCVSKGQPRGTEKHLTGWGKLEPYIDKDVSPALEEITAEQLEVLLEAIHLGDGAKQLGQSWTRRSYHIVTGNLIFAERLQSLCVRRGFKCNIAKKGAKYYTIHIKKVTAHHVGGKHATDRAHLEISPSTPGELVWCVENELGTLVTRRNGKVAIVGNCIGRVLRLAPTKTDALILDATDNILNHRLEPQTLASVVGIALQDSETVLDAQARKRGAEQESREKRERTTKEGKRMQDLTINVLERLDWQHRKDGSFALEVGPLKHNIVLVPCAERDGSYSVWASLAPKFEKQQWLRDAPLGWAQQFAEKRARMLLADPQKVKLVDRNAPWRSLPVDPGGKQALYLRRFGIPLTENLTRGEASDILEQKFAEKAEQRRAKKAGQKEKTNELTGSAQGIT